VLLNRRGQPDQAFFAVQLLDSRVGRGAVELLVDVVVGHQGDAGVFPEHVQLAAFLGTARQVAAQAAGDPHVVALAAQVLSGDGRQYGLLGEHPRAEADHGFVCSLRDARTQQGQAQYDA